MKLFVTSTSPYARKVRVVAIEKGLADQIEEMFVNPLGDDTTDLLGANPLGKVPALVLKDGRRLFDSMIICEYLDDLVAASSLLPADRNDRIDAQVRHALANGMIDAALNTVLERMRPDMQRSALWQSRWAAAIARGVEAISQSIVIDRFDLGDLAAAVALLYIDFRLPEIEWRKASPALADWVDRQARRPSLMVTAPPS